ncbi:Bardet-Biedl syndrome 5-like protein [Aphelenchoides besseyi]|nr:Bardet-Biedl syndrome 5-like protein [Aphelenchoides besseyi]KAI6200270.1 Bardet-Biedl syndrome 5-like protein [Aphelenchoides besseyi]
MIYRKRDFSFIAMSDGIWQDRDILFDVDSRSLRLIPGEFLVERIENVEDTKGNNGDKGVLRITNIRLIWHANAMPRINLSIGYNSVHGVTTRILKSKIRGHAESLYLMARNATTRFEFVFTCANPSHTKLFTTVIGIHRAFETTKLYRELKMRGALVDETEKLRILPLENQSDRIEGVWNLSSDQGNLGVLLITNIRVVWYATMNPLYNVSIPYLQLRSCRIRDSKFGAALVMETSVQSGEYILGFRVDPEERLDQVSKAIQSFHASYLSAPIFGVQYSKDKGTTLIPTDDANEEAQQDDVEIEDRQMRVDAFAAYFSDSGGTTEHRPITFSEELGVAIEQLKPGFTLSDLWKIDLE